MIDQMGVKNYKFRKLMKIEFFQYILIRRGSEYVRSQEDFVCMNPEEIFLTARVFSLKAEKYPNMKIAFERAGEFLEALACDFGKIDVKVHPVLANKFEFPLVEPVPKYTEGFKDMSLGATSYHELGVVYKKAQDGPKYFIPVITIHRLTKTQLDITFSSIKRVRHTTDEVKFEISRRIQ